MTAAPPRRQFLLRQLLTGVILIFTLNISNTIAAAGDDHTVTMNMRDGDIRALIQWIAEQTHKQIVIDPRVQGRVSVFADQPVTISQAYQIFLATMQTQGFATSETEGVLKIFPVALAKGGPRELIDNRADLVASGQAMHVVNLKNVLAGQLSELIKPLLSPTGYAAPLAGTNSLLLADDSDAVSQLADLARRLDSDGSLDVDVIKLKHASARDIVQVLTPLTRGSANTNAATATTLSIAADERSNTVLLAGDPANRSRTRQLVQQLDQPISATGFTRVVFLNYLGADELVPVLKSIVGSQQKDAKEQSQQGSVSIEASKSTNALVLTGSPELLDSMQETIAKLDVRRAQVLVQAIIVEVSQELANSLGVQWSTDFNSDGSQAATNFGLAPTAAAIAAGSASPMSLLSSGLTLGYLKNGSLRAVINALATTADANLLSTPSVMTLDNQQAEILVGSNIPIITGQAATDVNGTTNPFTTLERKDIGVKLKVTPQINRDINHSTAITLDILQEVETVARDAASTSRDVVTNKRSINTKVIVNDTDILVLGGLISDEDQKLVSKVPILGDMPLVGALFRSTSTKTVKRNLMVFIHPTIIDSDTGAEMLSRERYEELRQPQPAPSTTTEAKGIKTLPDFETFKPQTNTAATPN